MKIEVEISDADVVLINRFFELANQSDANTHGKLDFKTLAEMLLEDVALSVRRPGSWEGANMAQVLTSHGYEI
jgi:hypothetical protein